MLKPKEFGKVLARKRSDKRWTQGQLGDLIGTDQSFISKLERGVETPSLDVLMRLADALELDNPGFLFDALAGRIDESDALIQANVLKVPDDFSPEEWADLEDALNFILWKRDKGMAAGMLGLGSTDKQTMDKILDTVSRSLSDLAELENRIRRGSNPPELPPASPQPERENHTAKLDEQPPPHK